MVRIVYCKKSFLIYKFTFLTEDLECIFFCNQHAFINIGKEIQKKSINIHQVTIN